MNIVKDQNNLSSSMAGPTQITPEMLRNSKTVKCGDCEGVIFSEKIIFKTISPIISRSGKEEILPMPVMVCEKCGKILSISDPYDILPEELKDKKA